MLWGDERGRAFMQDLHDYAAKISPSNGDSADLVARGEFAFSLVDSDDVVNRMKQHQPVTMVYPDQGADEIGCFIVPNAAVLIAGCASSRDRQEAHRLPAFERNREKARLFRCGPDSAAPWRSNAASIAAD